MNEREREIEAKAAYSAIHNALINTYGWADAQDADRASRGMSSSQYQTARAPLFAVQEYVRELERKLVSVEAALETRVRETEAALSAAQYERSALVQALTLLMAEQGLSYMGVFDGYEIRREGLFLSLVKDDDDAAALGKRVDGEA